MTRELEPDGTDGELFKVEDNEVQLYKDAYYSLFEVYGFLMTAFFNYPDGDSLDIDISVGRRKILIDGEEFYRKTMPQIIGTVANRLGEMGETDFALGVNEMMREKWGTK